MSLKSLLSFFDSPFRPRKAKAGFNIDDFRSHYSKYGEVAKADKFLVQLTPPALLRTSEFGAKELTFQCEAAEFPGIDITPIEYRHYAFVKRIPGHLNFTPLTLTFYCNGEMVEKKFFDVWFSACIARMGQAAGTVEYRLDDTGTPNYETDIKIMQYDQVSREVYYSEALECMPLSMSALQTNWSDDSIHRLSVTFGFTKWIADSDKKTEEMMDEVTVRGSNWNNQINSIINKGIDVKNAAKIGIGSINNVTGTVQSYKDLLGNLDTQIPSTKSIKNPFKSF